MNAQTLTTPAIIYNFMIAIPEERICASSHDYGFDFNEAELAEELIAPLPASFADQPISRERSDEFENVFQYFIS